jgi:mRNA interferase RelE/StbE
MIVKIDKIFEKDTDKIKDRITRNKIADTIEIVKDADKLTSIKNIKKLKGSNKFYRIRIGDYRIGLIIEDEVIKFIRCLHRKDIYKFFPK